MEKKLSNKTLFVFIAMNFVVSMSASLFNAIMDQLVVSMNIPVSQVGSLSSFYAYGAGIGVPVFLIFFRKFDRTFLLKLMLILNIASTGALLVVSHFGMLLGLRFMMGLAGNCYNVLATATVAKFSPPEKVGKNIATLIAGAATALMIGLPLTRALSHILSWKMIFMILIGIMILSLFYYMFFLPSNKTEENGSMKEELEFFKDKTVVIQILVSLLTFVGYGGFYMYLTPYLTTLFPHIGAMMSVILVIVGICSFSGNLLGGYVCDLLGYKKSLILGSIIQIVLSLGIFLTQSFFIINIVLIFLWMINGWFIGLQINTGITIVTQNRSSFMISLNSSGIQLGQAIGATLVSLIIANIGMNYIICISTVFSLIALVLLGVNQIKE